MSRAIPATAMSLVASLALWKRAVTMNFRIPTMGGVCWTEHEPLLSLMLQGVYGRSLSGHYGFGI